MALSFYWHDYETWGIDPRRDRAVQFAGIRTDSELNIVGRPLVVFSKPANDLLPQPGACLITGITPQQALEEGVSEAEFFAMIHQEMAQPGTCGVGYNSIRFDDEFTRYGLYRNFFDPYAREWQNGNSRWDIIDLVRLTHALRPEGINWPKGDDGVTSFKLERLTEANGIAHEAAHDALSDVHATIAMARLIREKQPRLFDYLLKLRDKRKVGELLNLQRPEPVLHVSSMYPAALGCIAMVVPLAQHPTNPNGVIVYDLRHDPEPLISLSAEEVAERLFTSREALPEGVERMPLKTIHLNKSPAVVPLNTLTDEAAERWRIDREQAQGYLQRLKGTPGLAGKISQVHSSREFPPVTDPDQNLYGGGFFSTADRRQMETIRATEPTALGSRQVDFDDLRLPEMLFRYRARNWPETLSRQEQEQWEHYRRTRLMDEGGGSSLTLSQYRRTLAEMMIDPAHGERERAILSQLADWPAVIGL